MHETLFDFVKLQQNGSDKPGKYTTAALQMGNFFNPIDFLFFHI